MEIERKFLLSYYPNDLEVIKVYKITQNYIYVNKDEECRIRKIDDLNGNIKYFKCKKAGKSMVREEKDEQINWVHGSLLLKALPTKPIEKYRNVCKYNNYEFEIDTFLRELDHLIIIEIEFNTVKEANDFKIPKWFGKEVTGKINNSELWKKINNKE